MVDKIYCMSSYLAFRYIEKGDVDFFDEMHHHNILLIPDNEKIKVRSADEIDVAMRKAIDQHSDKKLGLMLSGGMDSAILASYMPGCDAYTFRFLRGDYQCEELKRAEKYAEIYGLNLHYVDIDWHIVEDELDKVMKTKAAPVHSIEPQIVHAALEAKKDGVEKMIIGNGSDYVFGGMDGLLSKDWTFDEFVNRYIYINPKDVLNEVADVKYIFEKYRQVEYIDYIGFMNEVAVIESYSSYWNAFKTAEMPYLDPYANLVMGDKLDLSRVRNGESKYLIRELFALKYPDISVPDKLPMPRPVDFYFADWEGPKRTEFRKDIDISKFSGNQKWQLYCLERFLNTFDT